MKRSVLEFYCASRLFKWGVFFIFMKLDIYGGDIIKQANKAGTAIHNGINEIITEKEQKLIKILRNVEYGEVVIVVKGGTPVHIEEIKKSIKL